MSLVKLCRDGDLEGVKQALQSGADVNANDWYGSTGLMWAVDNNHNSVVALLLENQNIDVNWKNDGGWCALHWAVRSQNNKALKMLLNVPGIDVNIVNNKGWSAIHRAVIKDNIEGLKLLLGHPSLTALTLNHKDKKGDTAVMQALTGKRLEHLAVLIADPRVDLDITDREGRSLDEVARWVFFSCGILKIARTHMDWVFCQMRTIFFTIRHFLGKFTNFQVHTYQYRDLQ